MGKHYILKVFSGPHIGAEILLARGKMLIGRGDQCDIILYDSAISTEHVELVISDQEIQLSSIDQPIFIAGKALNEKTVNVDTYQFITIGTTHFSIGINGEDWPQMSIPELDFLSKETAPSTTDTDTSIDLKPNSPFNYLTIPEIKRVIAKYLVGLKYTKLSAALSLVLTTGVAVAASMVLDGESLQQQEATYASIDGVFQKHNISKKKIEITPETITELQHKITQAEFSGIKLKQLNNILLVQGNVTSRAQKKQLIKLLEPYIEKMQLQVYIKQQQLSSAQTIASELDIDKLSFSITKPNILTVKGYVENDSDWLQAKTVLKDDVEGISEIDDQHLETQQHRIRELEELLEEQELLSLIDIKSSPGQILAMAELTKENAQRWKTVAYTFKQRYGKHPFLKSKIILLKTDPEDLNIEIRGVITTSDGNNIVLTSSGNYKQGEQFPNGFTIKLIQPKKVILSKNRQEIELSITSQAYKEHTLDTELTDKL